MVLRKRLFLFMLLSMLGCDKDLTSSQNQPLVSYIFVVTDSLTQAPLDSVKIRVTTISGDTSIHFTDRLEGRAELPSLASSRTRFVLSRTGYRTLDYVDTVSALPDTIFNRALIKLLNFKLTPLSSSRGGLVQVNLLLRNDELTRLRKGKTTYLDSLGVEKSAGDNDTDGTIGLSGLKEGKNQVRVEHSGYLGRFIEVNVDKRTADIRLIPNSTVTLTALNNSVSGQLYFKTATGTSPLTDAKVEFHLKDSLSYPRYFRTFTSPDVAKGGLFQFTELPPMDGELRFYKDRTASEPTKTMSMTKEEVLRDGPIAPVTLTISQDSTLRAVAVETPKDTMLPKDTLVFKFNQRVVRLGDPVVRLINISQRLWTVATLDSTGRILKIVQAEDDWIPGKKYEYQLSLFNDQGEPFSRPGDISQFVRGEFVVKASTGTDTALIYPDGVRLAYFNSGKDRRFDSLHLETSPLGDSTTRFARLKWNWKAGGNRVDSLKVYIRDEGAARPAWTEWVAIPGFADSATLDFSEIYSVAGSVNQNPVFPIRTSPAAEISLKVLFQEGGKELDRVVELARVKQGMGPSVYAIYDTLDGLQRGLGATDEIEVTFRKNPADAGSVVDFGATPPMPETYGGAVNDTAHTQWSWVEGAVGKKGRLRYVYTASESPPQFSRFRVDLSRETFDRKPIWHRNRHLGVGFD